MPTVNEVVAGNVRRLRQERGWSQRELADRLDSTWTRPAVAALESQGVRARDVVDLVALSRALGVQVEDLLAGDVEAEMPSGEQVPLSAFRDALMGRLRPTPAQPQVLRWSGDDPEEMERTARRLDLDVEGLRHASMYAFGTQRFLVERDERAAVTAETPKRTAQARRGHATRAMLAEIRAAFEAHGREEVLRLGAAAPEQQDRHATHVLDLFAQMGFNVNITGDGSARLS